MPDEHDDRSFLMGLLLGGVLRQFTFEEVKPELFVGNGRLRLTSPWSGQRFELTLRVMEPDPKPKERS